MQPLRCFTWQTAVTRQLAREEKGTQGNELVVNLRVHRLGSCTQQPLPNVLTLGLFFRENIGTQPLKAPVIVISDISERLAGPGGYLAETIPLKKMEFKGLPLFCGDFSSKPIQQDPARDMIYRYLPPGRRRPLFVELQNAVVMSNIQVSSAVDCSLVGHLNDPRCP